MNISHEVLSRDAVVSIIKVDATKFKADVSKYTNANTLSYYVAINTWYHIVAECDIWAAQALLKSIQTYGLLTVVKQCNDDADRLVKGEDPLSDIGRLLVTISTSSSKRYFGLDEGRNVFKQDLATALQLLRYLRRFSPSKNDWIKEASLQDFIATENVVKMRQRTEYPKWLVDELRDEINQLLDWDSMRIRIEREVTITEFKLPEGTTKEGLSTFGDKLTFVANHYPEAFIQPMGYPYVFPYYEKDMDDHASEVNAVPKSYKASRIIAKEHVWRQARAGVIARILQDYLPEFVDITDQSRNQNLAKLGSMDGSLATLDASHASDLISKTLYRSIFPEWYVRVCDELFSTYHICKGKKRMMQMMSTAGHSLTFGNETMVYYAIARVATNLVERLTGDKLGVVSAYGDDVVLPTGAAETAIDLYHILGLRINVDKSFIEGNYRESCGEEYLYGVNLTTIYYPRFPVVGKLTSKSIELGVKMYRDSYRGKIDDSTTMLIDLQKRLFTVSYNASLFVWEVLTTARPRLTTSVYGTICEDLWGGVGIAPTANLASRMLDKGINVPKSVVSACESKRHSYPSIQYSLPKNRKISEQEERAFNAYKYYRFLKTGPTFASALDELLGVSEPPMSLSTAFGEGKLVWRYTEE
jgi:hypothetical protein